MKCPRPCQSFTRLHHHTLLSFAATLLIIASTYSNAAGMVPDTTVILINAAEGEGSINVTNTETSVALLNVSLENLPEDNDDLVLVTTPISRVEPGEKQLVRFIVQADEPITTQRMKRVSFEGIPQGGEGVNVVSVNVRQNLPLIINPVGLANKSDPWTLLKWSLKGNSLTVSNDSRYVVRFSDQAQLLPSKLPVRLPRTYLLPGDAYTVELPSGSKVPADSKVRVHPASLYGFEVRPYDAPLTF